MLAITLAVRAEQPEPGQLDASPTLFTVMAALNAAGFDAGLDAPNSHRLRKEVREELARRDIPSLAAIRQFVAEHRQRDATAELSQYISFALTVGNPPDFALRKRDVEIPPEALKLQEFSKLLVPFYKEADIARIWQRAQPEIDEYIARYHTPVSQVVLQVNAYLRQQTSGFKGRRFQIFIELLAPPGQVQRRSYGFEDTVVVTPSAEPRSFDIRHAYLHYLLDPMASRNQEILDRKKFLLQQAQRVGRLEDSFRDDFGALTTESLIKAVESRLDHDPAAIERALYQGFVLAPYFSEALQLYEKQEQSMMVYYPEMAGAIDLKTEEARLSRIDFNAGPPHAAKPVAPAAAAPAAPAAPLTGAAKTLDEAEWLYTARALDAAKKKYLEVLEQTDEKPLHADAYYGLARIAALNRDPETAVRLFQSALDLGPRPATRAWVLVYLGKLTLAAEQPEQAQQYFVTALQVEGISDKARTEAENGLRASSKP
ncbi:MAG TPA: tetratricopeptide repeat protein [Bryobacteraceae bacterium]